VTGGRVRVIRICTSRFGRAEAAGREGNVVRRLLVIALSLLPWLLHGPAGASAQSSLYASSFGDNTIVRFSPAGQPSQFASGLNGPAGLAFDASGSLFEADIYGNGIRKFSASGQSLGFFAGPGAPFVNPNAVAFDSAGVLYVANGGNTFGNNQILRFSPTGQQLPGVPLPNVTALYGLAFDPAGNLYASDRFSNSVHKFSPTGQSLGEFATGLQDPIGLAFAANGNLFVANSTGNTVGVYAPSGQLLNTLSSGLQHPYGLAVGPDGTLFVSNDTTIHMFSSTGVDLGDFATGLNAPWGLAFSPAPVPEPGHILALVLAGVASVGGASRLRAGWRTTRRANRTE
jgi:DNA-binding beta-propeller fold protein YncE